MVWSEFDPGHLCVAGLQYTVAVAVAVALPALAGVLPLRKLSLAEMLLTHHLMMPDNIADCLRYPMCTCPASLQDL